MSTLESPRKNEERDCSQALCWINEKGERVQHADELDGFTIEMLRGPREVILDQLLHYRSCLETNDPSPHALVTHRLRVLVESLAIRSSNTQLKKTESLTSFAQHVVQPYDELVNDFQTINSDEKSADAAIRQMETQVLVRLQFWSQLGDDFVKMYKKLKLCQKKKRRKASGSSTKGGKVVQGRDQLLGEIIELLSTTAIRLPQNRPFQSFLQGCLDASFVENSMMPLDVFSKIFDFFEIANPFSPTPPEEFTQFSAKPLASKQKMPSAVLPLPEMAKYRKENIDQRAHLSQNACQQQTKAEANDNTNGNTKKSKKLSQDNVECNELLKKPVSLLKQSKKSNTLLAGSTGSQRTQFVGSHFNSGLSNMSSLFRQVKVIHPKPVKKPLNSSNTGTKGKPVVTQSIQSKSSLLAKANKSTSRAAHINNNKGRKITIADPDPSSSSQQGRKRKQSQCFQTGNRPITRKKQNLGNQTVVQETPLPKKKTKSRTEDLRANSTRHGGNSARQVVAAARSALLRRQV